LTFFNSAVLLFLLNAEFLGLIFIIVYVGAIAVLFLFVVMMLNVKVIPADNTMYLPLIFIGSIFLFTQLYSFFQKGFTA
jgi:NADH-quinone oxidoreductase subunit J